MQHEKHSDTPQHIDTSFEGLAARLLAHDTSNRGHLLRAFQEGSDNFEEKLEDVAYVAAMQIPEYAEGAARLKSQKVKGEEAEKLATRQRQIYDDIRRAIVLELGIPTAEALSDIENTRLDIAEKLKDIEPGLPQEEYLRALGILKEDKEGKESTVYPRDLFPESMNEKWDTYIDTVKGTMEASRKLTLGDIEQADFVTADLVRKVAHDSIASDVHKVLDLENLKGIEWPYKDARKLVEYMREQRFADHQAGKEAEPTPGHTPSHFGIVAVRHLVRRHRS